MNCFRGEGGGGRCHEGKGKGEGKRKACANITVERLKMIMEIRKKKYVKEWRHVKKGGK